MNGEKPKHIVAKPIHTIDSSKPQVTKRQLWAKVAYLYPQYTLKEASELSIRDIRLLLHVANQVDAERMFQLTQIAAAPHTKKGKGVEKLTKHFKEIINT